MTNITNEIIKKSDGIFIKNIKGMMKDIILPDRRGMKPVIKITGKKIEFISTDGIRFITKKIFLDANTDLNESFFIDAKHVKNIASCMGKMAKIYTENGKLIVDSSVDFFRYIMDYTQYDNDYTVIRNQFKQIGYSTFNRKDLIKILSDTMKQIKIKKEDLSLRFTRNNNRVFKIEFLRRNGSDDYTILSKYTITVSITNQEDIKVTFKPMYVNCSYFVDVLKVCGDSRITLAYNEKSDGSIEIFNISDSETDILIGCLNIKEQCIHEDETN